MANHSPAELALVQQLFNQADPQQLGIITGDAALQVFGKTSLPASTLGEIWAIADKDNNGFLTKKDTAVALRLIGHAQKGEAITEDLVNKRMFRVSGLVNLDVDAKMFIAGPLAHLDGFSPAVPSAPRSPVPSAGLNTALPPFTPDDKTKFLRIFVGAGPVNGLLSGVYSNFRILENVKLVSGDKARDIFLKSKLSFEKLSQIW